MGLGDSDLAVTEREVATCLSAINKQKGGVRKYVEDLLARVDWDPVAQFNLALLYQLGQGGLAKDQAEALRLYRLAADRGYNHALNQLAIMHLNGMFGMPKDEAEGVRLYRASAEQGDSTAQVLVGQYFEKGTGGLPKDEAEAVRLYRLSSAQGQVLRGSSRAGIPPHSEHICSKHLC